MPLLKKKDFSAIARVALSGVEKRDIQLLSQPSTDFQTLMTTMDTSRSYITVLGVDVVDAEPAQTQLSTGGDKAEAVVRNVIGRSRSSTPANAPAQPGGAVGAVALPGQAVSEVVPAVAATTLNYSFEFLPG